MLLENGRGPQIGTYVREEKIIYGRADQPIEYPDFTVKEENKSYNENGDDLKVESQHSMNS